QPRRGGDRDLRPAAGGRLRAAGRGGGQGGVEMTETIQQPSEELVPEDDRVIGRAFRWSVVVVAALAAIGSAIAWVALRPEKPKPTVDPVRPSPVAFVPPAEAPALHFTDIAAEAGVDFVHFNGAFGEKLLPETMGGGCAFLDYDGDGD